jgi:hypothetical protein
MKRLRFPEGFSSKQRFAKRLKLAKTCYTHPARPLRRSKGAVYRPYCGLQQVPLCIDCPWKFELFTPFSML